MMKKRRRKLDATSRRAENSLRYLRRGQVAGLSNAAALCCRRVSRSTAAQGCTRQEAWRSRRRQPFEPPGPGCGIAGSESSGSFV
jgi:hypothetical protein